MIDINAILQIIVAFGLINVWILRFKRPTAYRGGGAKSMKEEFAAYGLPEGAVYVVGALKLGIAILMLVGLLFPVVVLPATSLLVALMLGAVAMHIKVKDPLKKSIPALFMLAMSLWIGLSASGYVSIAS